MATTLFLFSGFVATGQSTLYLRMGKREQVKRIKLQPYAAQTTKD